VGTAGAGFEFCEGWEAQQSQLPQEAAQSLIVALTQHGAGMDELAETGTICCPSNSTPNKMTSTCFTRYTVTIKQFTCQQRSIYPLLSSIF
jgi:hypothetical protein